MKNFRFFGRWCKIDGDDAHRDLVLCSEEFVNALRSGDRMRALRKSDELWVLLLEQDQDDKHVRDMTGLIRDVKVDLFHDRSMEQILSRLEKLQSQHLSSYRYDVFVYRIDIWEGEMTELKPRRIVF